MTGIQHVAARASDCGWGPHFAAFCLSTQVSASIALHMQELPELCVSAKILPVPVRRGRCILSAPPASRHAN